MITRVHFLRVGYCTGPEWVARRGGRWRNRDYPALVAVLWHSVEGIILWDTGYSPHLRQLYRKFPWCMQSLVLPVRLPEEEQLPRQLAALGIQPDEVRTIILSHFHADHLGALRDFPGARIIFSDAAWDSVRHLGSFASARHSFHHGLLPDDFPRKCDAALTRETAQPDKYFHAAWPLSIGGLTAVSLPGHAVGQIGLRFSCDSTEYLLCADALWLIDNLHDHPPAWLGRRLMHSTRDFDDTRLRLQTFAKAHPQARIIPSHCAATLESLTTAQAQNPSAR